VTLWALNFTVTKYVLSHGFRPLAYSGVRYGAAALVFAGITFARERSLAVRLRDVPVLIAPAVGFLLLNQLGYVYSIDYTTASTVALILGSTPVFVALFALASGLERPSRAFWLGAAASFAGVALIAAGGEGGLSGNLKGDLLAVMTAATWGAYSIAIAPLMRRYSPYRISAVVLLFTWGGLLIAGSPQLAKQDFHLGWLVWVCFAFAVLGPLVTTNVLWFTSIDRVGPSRASLFVNIQPFFGAVFALLILSEHLGPLQIVGGFAIAAGIALERRARAPAVTAAGAE
jgi:drug/metabolite transporter (DMT)-like permease